jgi:hypothetical protein
MTGFFEEVKRRKVYRVAAAYIIAAGGIIQLASATFPAWELPNWALRLVILLVLVGFPIALILAWAFDITAQGIRATPDTAAPTTSSAVPHHTDRNHVIVSAIAGFSSPYFSARRSQIDRGLPENLSDEKEKPISPTRPDLCHEACEDKRSQGDFTHIGDAIPGTADKPS